MVNELSQLGISADDVQWSEITELCLSLKSSDSNAYQQCMLDKAILQSDYKTDDNSCSDSANAFNPGALGYKAVVGENAVKRGLIEPTLTVLNAAPVVTNEAAFRSYMHDQCMRNLGWRNPRDYRRGHKQ